MFISSIQTVKATKKPFLNDKKSKDPPQKDYNALCVFPNGNDQLI